MPAHLVVTLSMMYRASKILLYGSLYLITFGIIASVFFFTPHNNNDFPLLRLLIIFFATVLLSKYFIYMIIAPWHEVKKTLWERRDNSFNQNFRPLVSVIIPAWNEEVGLLQTVRTILASQYKHVEILVVNDGSTDNSDAMMREFLARYDEENSKRKNTIVVKYFYKENGGKALALNHGIEHAKGDIIMSIDADCAIAPDAVGNFVKCFEDPNVMAAVGNVKIGNTKTILGTIQYLEFLFSFYFKKTECILNTIYIIGGAAGAFRKEVFERVGVYHHSNITEDIDLSVRIQAAGMKIAYASDALVYTEGAVSVSDLIKQRLRWKRGRFQTFAEHRNMFFSTRKHHNKILTWGMFPLAIFGEAQLICELFFITFLYVYSYLTHDFSSFISGIIVVSVMFFVQIIFDDSSTKKISFILLAPIGWLLFYLSTYVEFSALVRSLWGALRKQDIAWQKWKRNGVLS